MARILIAGCGDIGCRLGKQLTKQGHEVFGIRRSDDKMPSSISPIKADLFAPLPELPGPFDYVYYIVSASAFNDIGYYRAYVLGLRNVIKALDEQGFSEGIRRLFFISSSSVFTQNNGETVTEDSPTEGKNFASRRLLEAEDLALNAPFPGTVVRFGGIYGPGRTYLIDMVLKGQAHCMEDVYSNRIHTEDAVGVLAHLLTVKPLEPVYIGVDNEPTLICDVYEWLAEQLSASVVEHNEPTENSRAQRGNKRLSNARIRASGYEFKYPSFREGYTALLEEVNEDTDGHLID
ncbi:MAG: SDR family oxidoreductase [Hydrogenovibrio sp.]|uniref:SDR family oxidoreductase n=1 Tax=Hydrogenovibrio sp. TaxID=2065821 RepID=UPI0028705157|nr:SDR family oxidoreductase [Hydrogenovibrio sp.]MDR9498128.1 SDR family oxidoreductase [Hydrogenovibrio sp.]